MEYEWGGWMLGGYLVGSIPVGYLWARAARGIDIRKHGSGNIGATNVARVLDSRTAGFSVFALDALKGWLPVWAYLGAARQAWGPGVFLVAAAPFLGHCFPVFLGFKGGKGVATGLGVVAALFPLAALLSFALWCASAATTRYVSVSSILAALALPVWLWLGFWGRPPLPGERFPALLFATVCTVFVVWRHRLNLARLKAGTESRIGQRQGTGQRGQG